MLRDLFMRVFHGDAGKTISVDAAVESLPEGGEFTVEPVGDAGSGVATHAAHPELKAKKGKGK